jgi:uncharacterized protein YehS (DUF1456 family)
MDNNDILRRIRYMFDYTDKQMGELATLGGYRLSPRGARARMLREDEQGAIFCEDGILEAFLDGLILHLRGPHPGSALALARPPLTNNEVLKKMRIALKFRDEDMLKAMRDGGMTISKAELTALFRVPTHRHHRPCGDQLLRKFLVGVTPMVQHRRHADQS